MRLTPTNIIALSLTAIMLLSGAILSGSIASADGDSVVDEINITVPVSCTLSGTGMTSHNAEINNGQYNSAIGETTLKAFCNDNEGFAIYAIGYTGNEEGNNVLTNSTLGSTYDIVTGTATSGNTSNWAMKLSTITSPTPTYPIIIAGTSVDTLKEQGDPDFTSFQEVPDDYTKVAYRTSSTDIGTNAEGSTLKSTYQAYISSTQPAGTYTGQVKYTLVHPHDAAAPVMCKPNGTTITTIACMQDISSTNKSTILASMTEEQQYALVDKRDEKTYTVAKLKDGNIWMTQNLDLDLDSSMTYTNEDTDIGWNSSTNSYNTASWTPVRSTYITGNLNWCTGGTLTQYGNCDNFTPESYDPGNHYWNGELYIDSSQISNTGIPQYHLGNYYNWSAAVAVNDGSGYFTEMYYDMDQSICPAGWTLPKGGNNNELGSGSFKYLFEQYGYTSSSYQFSGDYKPYQSPLFINYSSYLRSSSDFPRVGSGASLLTAIAQLNTIGQSSYRYALVADSSGINGFGSPNQGGANLGSGYSVRCVAR